MRARRSFRFPSTLLALWCVALPVLAQYPNGNGNGNGWTAFGGSMMLQALKAETTSTMERDSEVTDLRQAMNLYFRSFILDQRFITYRLFTDFLQQDVDSGGDGVAASDATAYGISVNFFPERRIPFSLFYSERDSETEYEDQQYLSQQLHYTTYGGSAQTGFSILKHLRVAYDRKEREGTGGVNYLYDDKHLTGMMISAIKSSQVEIDYDSKETFNELSRNLQENTTWRLRNDNRLGEKQRLYLNASRNETASEQEGFARAEAEFSTYDGQWIGNWSEKWNTTAGAFRSEGEAKGSETEANSYRLNVQFAPNKRWTLYASANTSESTLTSTSVESELEARSVFLNTSWTRPSKMWSFTLNGGGGQNDSEMEWTPLLPPGPTEQAQFDTLTWSAGGSITRGTGLSNVSLSSSYSSSEFDVATTVGVVLGAQQSLGFSEDVWRARFEARTLRRKLGEMRGYVDYVSSERLLEDGTFAESTNTSINTFWRNHTWSTTASYGVIETRDVSGQEAENTFLHANASRSFWKYFRFSCFYTQTETTIGVVDLGTQRYYEASIDYSVGKFTVSIAARHRELERDTAQAESSVYYVMLSRRFRKFL
ncbi:MAG: hypothetical protein JSV08_08500 [Acidobacteriota bacterium]|nr:MAG: hypothetical protein JSV08_08500 [Acidobacteriota bacterium]